MLEQPVVSQCEALDALRSATIGFEHERREPQGVMISVEALRPILARCLPALDNENQYMLAFAVVMVVRPPVDLDMLNTPRERAQSLMQLLMKYLAWFKTSPCYGWQLLRYDDSKYVQILFNDGETRSSARFRV